jgi:hypothetical protein
MQLVSSSFGVGNNAGSAVSTECRCGDQLRTLGCCTLQKTSASVRFTAVLSNRDLITQNHPTGDSTRLTADGRMKFEM